MKKLLAIIDMQNDFITGSLANKKAEEIIPKIVEYIENYDGDICFTKDTHYEDYLDSQEGQRLPVNHCLINTWGWQITDELKKYADNSDMLIFEKQTFGSTDLAEVVEKGMYTQVDIVGTCTDICVISNAILIKTVSPETKIVVHSDMCAGVTKESHETALKAMIACQIDVT